MGTGAYSRRELLQLGGKLALTVGAAKIVVALPGCSSSARSKIDAGPDAFDNYPGYVTLDECHSIGTYHYALPYPTVPPSTYHTYWTGAYGCPGYVRPPTNVYCYTDIPDFAPGYEYFCFSGYYSLITSP